MRLVLFLTRSVPLFSRDDVGLSVSEVAIYR